MTTNAPTSARTWPRRLLDTILTIILTFAIVTGVVLAGVAVTSRSINRPVPTWSIGATSASAAYSEPDRPANPTANSAANRAAASRGRRLVVAFVAGTHGTVASDLLAPYDIFASSPAFTTYVAAAVATPAPLEGGPPVVPTYTFADVDADPTLTPDLVVVPALSQPTGAPEAPLRNWVAREHREGARVLGVCSGALVLTATGMLDGLHATSHWSRISALEQTRPAVHWMRGREYVDDGSVTTTAAVTSGVPAALHLVAELAGPAEAERVANLHPELGWTAGQSTTIAEDHFAARDWPVGLNYVMPWFRPTIGIALRDGVGELDATAAFEVYSQSAAAGTVALASSDTVRTSHGLVLLTTSFTHAPHLSVVVVPGAGGPDAIDSRLRAWANNKGLTVEPFAGRLGPDGSRTGGGFTAALQSLADHTDAATASVAAKMIGYPTTDVRLGDQHRSWRPVGLVLVSLALALLVGLAPAAMARRRRRGRLERNTLVGLDRLVNTSLVREVGSVATRRPHD